MDYGASLDPGLNSYASGVGTSLSLRSHRKQVPYSFRVVNANYINAYAFPGGTIAATHGIMLEMENEGELAGLMGYEIGHVNVRHSVQRAGQGLLTQVAVATATIAVGASDRGGGLGMEYMTRAGYAPDGMVGLMNVLVRQSKSKPGMLDTMFSSHPMSDERLAAMKADASGKYAKFGSGKLDRERYMDHTAGLRKNKPAIEEEQKGERLMSKKSFPEAEGHFRTALKSAPNDYTGLSLMSKCQVAQKKYEEAKQYAAQARLVNPNEAQAMQLAGVTNLATSNYSRAYQEFDAYERVMPGNPNAAFFKGISLEAMQDRPGAAREYQRYLKVVQSGNQAKHAATRLREWGYAK